MSTAERLIKFSSLGLLILVLAAIITIGQLPAAVGLITLPFAIAYLYFLFKYPGIGLYTGLLFSFLAVGMSRYIEAPVGLTIDLFLVLTLAAIFFKRLNSPSWQDIKNPVTWSILIWIIYCVLELLNPEVVSYTAWFYAVRSPAFYFLFSVMIGMAYFKKEKDLKNFIHFWLIFSVIAALYSFKQFYIGLDEAEKRWLMDNASTHVLFGNLRVFSFYSDAAQFGAAMAHATLVSLVLLLGNASLWRRIGYITCALVCGYAMVLSGTRGALFILFLGFISYIVLSKNIKIIFAGIVVALLFFGFLKFTYIGQSNYQIQRMRSAFNLEDPSFQVRIQNQLKLKEYLESRPFGGGIGSAGYWGLRFAPDTFLAKVPLDSWYVKIWAETGIVGIVLYIGILFFILTHLFIRLWKAKPSPIKQTLLALFAGLVGVTIANYGNQLLGQMPTAIIYYLSIAIIFNYTRQEKPEAYDLDPLEKSDKSDFSLHN